MTVAIHTLGCKVYQYETQAIEALLKEHRKGERFWDAYDVWVMESYMRMLKMWLFHPDNPHSEAEQKQAWKALMTTCPSLKRLHHVRWKKMYRARKSYPLLLFFLRYFRSYALNRRVAAWLLRTNRY